MSYELLQLRDVWAARWPEALALWSRFTQLREPRWCFDRADEKRESLASSFAMIRLDDHAVVISLAQIHEQQLDEFPLEIMGHEIGHHVYCPSDLADQARMIARIRRGLPTREQQTGLVANLYSDLLINDRLMRQANLNMAAVYKKLAGGSADKMWTLYMRIYEILWSLPAGSLVAPSGDPALDADAALGARLIRAYAKDWLKGAGRFAALLFSYLAENEGKAVKIALRGWLATDGGPSGVIPDGLVEIDDDEIDGAIHPSLDPDLSGTDLPEAPDPAASKPGDSVPRRRYREPSEYKEILRSAGVDVPDSELTIRYYRERALPYVIPFPVRELPSSREPLAEGLDGWDAGESLEQLDVMESLLASETIIPGVTTVQRVYGTDSGSPPEREPVDLYVGVDCSGSMANPSVQMSYPVLAGAIIALSALRAGARVMVTLSGEPGSFSTTGDFISDEHEILRILTGYLGTGYAFGIHRLAGTFAARDRRNRPVHILIVTDHDIFVMLREKSYGIDGWTVEREALEKARGGGTFVLHMPASWGESGEKRLTKDGWEVAHVLQWEDIVEFAREFSLRKYDQPRTAAAAAPTESGA
ncbi:MAG TPA: VWA domain-containing protein [Thermoanaerobaculia bacterium]|nr:VWA domain-containing protein [Thermoanaerobaculia bacterium]